MEAASLSASDSDARARPIGEERAPRSVDHRRLGLFLTKEPAEEPFRFDRRAPSRSSAEATSAGADWNRPAGSESAYLASNASPRASARGVSVAAPCLDASIGFVGDMAGELASALDVGHLLQRASARVTSGPPIPDPK